MLCLMLHYMSQLLERAAGVALRFCTAQKGLLPCTVPTSVGGSRRKMAVPLICCVCRWPASITVPHQQAQLVGRAQCRVGDYWGRCRRKALLAMQCAHLLAGPDLCLCSVER